MFLGDGGAYLISFIVGIILIRFFNDNPLLSPYYIAALLWYPAYENLFSIIRKKIFKKSPSAPDNEHLHQFVYLYLNKSLNISKNLSNPLSGILICLYNLFYLKVDIYFHFSLFFLLIYFLLNSL